MICPNRSLLFCNFIIRASYSPLMAEHLSYLKSKSHSYVYEFEKKRIARADENFAREVMQLFSSEFTDSAHTHILYSANKELETVLLLFETHHSGAYRAK